jgi:hypothetical protein
MLIKRPLVMSRIIISSFKKWYRVLIIQRFIIKNNGTLSIYMGIMCSHLTNLQVCSTVVYIETSLVKLKVDSFVICITVIAATKLKVVNINLEFSIIARILGGHTTYKNLQVVIKWHCNAIPCSQKLSPFFLHDDLSVEINTWDKLEHAN